MSRSQFFNKTAICFFAGLATAGCLDLCGLDPQEERCLEEDGKFERAPLKELSQELSNEDSPEGMVFSASDWRSF